MQSIMFCFLPHSEDDSLGAFVEEEEEEEEDEEIMTGGEEVCLLMVIAHSSYIIPVLTCTELWIRVQDCSTHLSETFFLFGAFQTCFI